MGFYFEMQPVTGAPNPENDLEFQETHPPRVFWVLFAFAGFALICMGLAANELLGTLASSAHWIDKTIVALILAAVPFYLGVGLKLGGVRKYFSVSQGFLWSGYVVLGKKCFSKKVEISQIQSVETFQQTPTPNRAPRQHDDQQYYIRGHWKLAAKLKNGKWFPLDRHSDEEALLPARNALRQALS